MFGREKEEEYEYIGQKRNNAVSLFQSYLYKGEKILYATGNGNSNESIIEKLNQLEDTKIGKAIAAAHMALLFGGIILCMLGYPIIGVIMIALFILIPIAGFIVLLIMYCTKPPSANGAITDKRVISMIGKNWDEIALKDVSETSIWNGNMIMVRTKGYSDTSTTDYLVIYKVQNPLGVKQMLDEAVRMAKMNQNQV